MKIQPLINLSCSNLSPPQSTFQIQAFLEEKTAHLVKEPEGRKLHTLERPLSKLQFLLGTGCIMLIWGPSSSLNNGQKWKCDGVTHCSANRQYSFPSLSWALSWRMDCKTHWPDLLMVAAGCQFRATLQSLPFNRVMQRNPFLISDFIHSAERQRPLKMMSVTRGCNLPPLSRLLLKFEFLFSVWDLRHLANASVN